MDEGEIFISELLRLSSIFYKIPSILLSVHRRRSSVQALREGEDGCLVHFVNMPITCPYAPWKLTVV